MWPDPKIVRTYVESLTNQERLILFNCLRGHDRPTTPAPCGLCALKDALEAKGYG